MCALIVLVATAGVHALSLKQARSLGARVDEEKKMMAESDLKSAREAFERRGMDDEGEYIDKSIFLVEAHAPKEDDSLVSKGAIMRRK